jgi:hypothetical protein
VNASGVQCLNLAASPAGDASAAACVAACCAAGSGGCGAWQWRAGTGCWTGPDCADLGPDPNGWVGGAASAGPAPPAACPGEGSPCDPAFDDSAWRSVDVPHDSVIENAFSPSDDPGHGALPRNVSWYRRHFSLDAALSGQLIYLTFDGVFRAADVYINGAFVAHHDEGYTSFVVFLHNASAPLVFGGGDNVLAVFVDGRTSELWCYEGNGIYRHVWLESAAPLSFVPWSFFAPSAVSGTISGADAQAPQTADGALFAPQVDVANAGAANASGAVLFALHAGAAGDGGLVVNVSVPFSVAPGGWQRVAAPPAAFGSAAAPVRLWNADPRGPPL